MMSEPTSILGRRALGRCGEPRALTAVRIALVLWNGDIGGAEVFSVSLAEQMRRLGAEVTIVFIEQPAPLITRLSDDDGRFVSLGLPRGRQIVRKPRRYARAIAPISPDGVLLMECGFMGAALRAGGYTAPIVAMEHGAMLSVRARGRARRALWQVGRASGAWVDDVEVGVSDFTLDRMRDGRHARVLTRIYNGVDPDRYGAVRPVTGSRGARCVVGFAARLVSGKGADYLLHALAELRSRRPVELRIAGDGPERRPLERLASRLGLSDLVTFLGLVHDMPRFWESSDIAVVASAEFIESCPMTPLEAMATGIPVVATRNGGLPELLLDGLTGQLVTPGDTRALAEAIDLYAADPSLRANHGRAGRAHVVEYFDIDSCARSYLQLFQRFAGRSAAAVSATQDSCRSAAGEAAGRRSRRSESRPAGQAARASEIQ